MLAVEATSGMGDVVRGTACYRLGRLSRRRISFCVVLELVVMSPTESSYQILSYLRQL